MYPELIKVLLIEDHPAMGYGTKVILEQDPNIQVVGVAETGGKGLEMVEQYQPMIIFLDYFLPDTTGKELVTIIKEQFPHIHIVVFTGYDYMPFFHELIKIGVSGMMMKSATPKQLMRMIESIIDGETVIPLTLFWNIQLSECQRQTDHWEMELSEREKKILHMLTKGYTNTQIAHELGVSTRSVEYYLSRIYEKLNVSSRTEAVEKYMRARGSLHN